MAAPDPGTVFPANSLRTEDGRPAPPPREETLYAFFHTECPTSELAWPYLERLGRMRTDRGLQLVGVSQDGPKETASFLDRLGLSAEILYDPPPWKASAALRLSSVPVLVHVSPEGVIRQIVEGFQKEKLEELAARAGELSGGAGGSLFRPGENVPAIRPG